MKLRGHTALLAATVLLSGAGGLFGATSAAGAASAGGAERSCAGFKWNVEHERALFKTAGKRAVAGRENASAPEIRADRLYDLSLAPQQDVHFVLQPQKKALTDGAFAGLARLHVATAGRYRISIDRPFWIDVIAQNQFIESQDFAGRHGCDAPRKIVVYELPSGDFILQLSGAISPRVRVTLTRVPAEARAAAPTRTPEPSSSP